MSNTFTYLFHYFFEQKFHCKGKKNLCDFVTACACVSTAFSVQHGTMYNIY